MPTYRLHLDSRARDAFSEPSEPCFSLSKTICNVKTVTVKNAQLANTIYNIRENYNDKISLSIDNGSSYATHTYMQQGFYGASAYVTGLDTFLSAITGSSCVSLNAATNQLTWTLPANVSIDGLGSSTSHVLGIDDRVLSGSNTSTLFLAGPMSISFVCPQLQATYNVFTNAHKMNITHPFLTVPIVNGFGNMEVYSPFSPFVIECGGQTLSTLDIRVVDTVSGMSITELSHWSMELEVEV
jgi:hypothetical protein